MTAGVTEHGLRAADVEAVLASYGFGTERPRAGAVILAVLDPLRIVWANQPAAALFETDEADDLFAQVFAGRGREGLGASVARLVPDGAPRLERLRLIRGFRSRTLAVAISRSRLPDGRPIVILTMPGHEGPGGAANGFALSGLRAVGSPPVEHAAPPPLEEPGAAAREERSPAPPSAEPANENGGPNLAALRDRFAGLRPARMLWQTDADHRLVKLTGGVPDLAGIDDPGVVGLPLAAVLQMADTAEQRGLAEALDSKTPWSGRRVRWPLATAEASLAVTLGAVPVISRSGRFDGFRGFGIVDLIDLAPSAPERLSGPGAEAAGSAGEAGRDAPTGPEPAFREDTAAQDETTSRDEQPILVEADEPSESAEDTEAKVAAAPADPDAPPADPPAPEAGSDRPFAASSKVVALRPYQIFAAAASSKTPKVGEPAAPIEPVAPPPEAGDGGGEEPADLADLTLSERSNFHEIGRALLGAEVEGPGEGTAPPALPAERNALRAIETLGLAVLVVGADSLHYANPSFHALTGYPTLEAVQAAGGLGRLLGGLDAETILDAAADRAFPVVDAAGGVIPMQGRLQPFAWDGAPARLLSMRPAADRIAQVQTLEGEIRRRDHETAELRAMLDSVTDGILTVDRQGRILTLNGAAVRLFGHAERDVAGEPLAMLIGPDAQVAVVDLDSAPEERQGGMDVVGRSASGRVLSLHLGWQQLSHGRSCVYLRDRGEHSALRRDLVRAHERADEALASRPDLLAKISHEIRTPLNAILGFAEVILDERFGPVGNERYRSYLTDIHTSGTEVLDLVSDLLDLSKMEAGRTEMRPAPLDVNRVIGECVGEVQAAAHRERVIVRLSLVPHLAAALIDERAFRQIMGHVLSNAIRFNEPGGQVIVSTAVNDAGAVAVRVRDTGMGMTEAEIASAMEPFAVSRTAQPGGTGLGLPLARALVEANGATMSVRSRKDEGTFVEIVLPTSPAEKMRVPA